jgi:outer membrane lipoprotein-sorting protein
MTASPLLRRTLAVLLPLLLLAPVAQAQSAASVVNEMRAWYENEFASIDTYVVETNLYTAYHRKVEDGERPEFETVTRLNGQDRSFAGMSPSTTQGPFDYIDALAEHGTHAGMETIDGTPCHILRVDDPSKLDASLGANAKQLTYYVSADDSRPRRMVFTVQVNDEADPQDVTVNLSDYRTVDGLTLPWTMEMKTNLGASLTPEQRKELEAMRTKLKNMPERQRKIMERMMGDQMEQLEKMASGEPTVIEVKNVSVNPPIPDDVFGGNS